MPKFKKTIAILLLLFISVVSLSGCKNVFKKEEADLTAKLNDEIKYLDKELILLINDFNNIKYGNFKVTVTEVKEDSNNTGNSNQAESTNSSNGNSENSQKKQGEGSTGSSGDSSSGENGQKQSQGEKANTQKDYEMVENSILEDNQQIDWKKIKTSIEVLASSWITVQIDLKSANVPDKKIEEFNNKLDLLIIAIKDETKNEAILNASEMHSLLYQFVELYNSNESNYINILKTKSKILQALGNVEDKKWEDAQKKLTEATDIFQIVANNPGADANKKVNIDRSALLLHELELVTKLQEKQVFLMKYKNCIQEMNIL